MAAGKRLGCIGGPGTSDPGLWRCTYAPLPNLIVDAYGLEWHQFIFPDWTVASRFDITAGVPAGTNKEQFRRMQQKLLEERFGLTLQHERREMAVYELVIAKGGLKLKETAPNGGLETGPRPSGPPELGKDGFPVFPPGHGGLIGFYGRWHWAGSTLTAGDIARTLSGRLGRAVIDATGLTGKYDIDMYWVSEGYIGLSPEEESLSPVFGPTLFHAVRSLGLKLNSKKGFVDVVAIRHVLRSPTEN